MMGCSSYAPESTEREAVAYYQDKYQVEAEVAESHKLGSQGLLCYNLMGVEYLMEDGSSVVCLDDDHLFLDNRRQSE